MIDRGSIAVWGGFSVLVLFVLFVCSIGDASAAITNINTISTENSIYVEWLNGSVEKTVQLENDTILYTATAPTIDGILETPYEAISHQYNIYSPNPEYVNQLDNVWMLYDNNYVYIGLLAHDRDSSITDEMIRFYIDVDNDGLDTNRDVMYELTEAGAAARYKWNGNSWVTWPGSGIQLATSGAGTNEYQLEARIPIAEITGGAFAYGYNTQMMIRRTHNIPPDLYRYYPHLQNGLVPSNVSTWANIEFVPAGQFGRTTQGTTTENDFNITGLGSYNWYRIFVYETLTPTSNATVTANTINEPQYTISGNVYDAVTGQPKYNVRVTADYQGDVVREDFTNITGGYTLEGLFNRSYLIAADDGYSVESIGVNLKDGSITGLEFYMPATPTAAQVERTTTELWMLYLMILIMIVFLSISIYTLFVSGPSIISIFTSMVPVLIAQKISNLWIDGTLTDSTKFLSDAGVVVTDTDVIRNVAMSNLFMFIAIGLALMTLIQLGLYLYFKYGEEEEDEGGY